MLKKPTRIAHALAPSDRLLRNHLAELLAGGAAHLDFDQAVANLPRAHRAGKPAGQPHTPWRLIEHMRLAQWDILKFSTDESHVSPDWPSGYWPAGDGPPSDRAWNASLKAFRTDLNAMLKLVADPATDLLAPIAWGQGQTILREAMLLADHNAYHLGQLVILRKILGD